MKKLFLALSLLIGFAYAGPDVSDQKDEEICSICRCSPTDVTTGAARFSCSPDHKYCKDCIDAWCSRCHTAENRPGSCPICRAEEGGFVPIPDEEFVGEIGDSDEHQRILAEAEELISSLEQEIAARRAARTEDPFLHRLQADPAAGSRRANTEDPFVRRLQAGPGVGARRVAAAPRPSLDETLTRFREAGDRYLSYRR